MKLHETVKNVYIKCLKPLFCIEVLSQDGTWNKVQSFNVTEKQQFYLVKTTTFQLLCTKTHIIIDEDGQEVFAVDALGKNIQTTAGIEKVVSVEQTSIYDNAYDLTLAKSTNKLYYTNGILSHNCLCIDEIAFIPKNIIEEFWASVIPIVSSDKNSKIIAVSTPNGASGKFYELWQQANSKDQAKNTDGWTPFRIDWWEVPGRDEKWKQQQIATIGTDKWLQEFCNEFVAGATSQKLIPDDVIEEHRKRQTEMKLAGQLKGKQQQVMSEDGSKVYTFTMWHEFKKDHVYLATSDVAEGIGGDSSVLYVWDVTDLKNIVMCAMFSAPNVSTIEFAFLTDRILKLYNKPWLACESNGIGAGYLDALRLTYGYDNIVREGKEGKYGVTSHVQVKGRACLWLREMFTTQGIGWTIYDPELVNEMGTFIKKDSKVHMVYNAVMGSHDDHMMALCWAAWILNPEIVEKYFIVVNSFKSSLDKILPKQLASYKECTDAEEAAVLNDPLYQSFIEAKQEMLQAIESYNGAAEARKAAKKKQLTFNQLFFNDDGDSGDWGSPWMPASNVRQEQSAQDMLQMPTAAKPMYFI